MILRNSFKPFILKAFLTYNRASFTFRCRSRTCLHANVSRKWIGKRNNLRAFLICYLSLFLLRVLEIKCFKNKINSYDLINFMRDFRVVNKGDNTYINISRNQSVNEKVKKLIGFSNLDALYLTKTEVDNFFQNCMLSDT